MFSKRFGNTVCATMVSAGMLVAAMGPVAAKGFVPASEVGATQSAGHSSKNPEEIGQNCRRVGKSYYC